MPEVLKHNADEPPVEIRRLSDEEVVKKLNQIDFDSEGIYKTLKTRLFKPETIMALGRLVIELGDELPTYDTILSDDASGRPVSLFMRKIIETKREELKKAPVNTYFLAGGRHNDPLVYDKIKEFLEKKSGKLGKTLLVTEHIESGRSIRKLADLLAGQGIDFDIAAVSLGSSPEYYDSEFLKHVYYGGIYSEGVDLYGRSGSGVIKEYYRENPSAHPHRAEREDKEKMRLVREDISTLASEFQKLL